jgi:hypothetical protein
MGWAEEVHNSGMMTLARSAVVVGEEVPAAVSVLAGLAMVPASA